MSPTDRTLAGKPLSATTASARPLGVIALVLGASLVVSILAGSGWDKASVRRTQSSFDSEARDIGRSLSASLQQDVDLMHGYEATLQVNGATNSSTQMASWVQAMGLSGHFPGVEGVLYLQRVGPDGLGAYRSTVEQDPPVPLPTGLEGGPFRVIPATDNLTACFMRYASFPDETSTLARSLDDLTGLNLCRLIRPALTTSQRQQQLVVLRPPTAAARAAIASAPGTLIAKTLQTLGPLIEETTLILSPVYTSSAAPEHAGGNLEGWVLGVFHLGAVLAAALPDDAHWSAELSAAGAGVLSTVGSVPAEPLSLSLSLDDPIRWKLEVVAPTPPGISAATQGLIVGSASGLLVILLAALLASLLWSRRQAIELAITRAGELQHRSLHDPITDLPNRELLLDRANELRQAIGRGSDMRVGVFHLSLDDFRLVHDLHGHAAGDQLLREVAGRLEDAVRGEDTVGHLGANEFAVFVSELRSESGDAVAGRLLGCFAKPYRLDHGVSVQMSASIGYAIGDGDHTDRLLAAAGIASQEAKTSGKGRYAQFTLHLQETVHRRLELDRDLHRALEHHQFALAYQPVFAIPTCVTTGAEALLRWRHPDFGPVSPSEFVPALEESGLIVAVGTWVINQACQHVRQWHLLGFAIDVAVNVSSIQLDEPDFVGSVMSSIEASGIRPSALVLELTERAFIADKPNTLTALEQLRSAGVRIAIDDFGTGYSSMSYLQRLPVDLLKIDKSFVDNLADGRDFDPLVRTIAQLAKRLDLETVAEGVETATQVEALRREGCTYGQGYLHCRPLPPADIPAFLARTATNLPAAGPR